MKHYDVFNGDADGICALVQLRLANPLESQLITGVKRDIALVKQVPTDTPSTLTVLDISLDKNRSAVDQQLANGSSVSYYDHHFAGESLPTSSHFNAFIDTDAHTCTSLIVDQQLAGRYRNWAITAAFGDNLNVVAQTLAEESGLSEDQTEQLKTLGVCINYNGYGRAVGDLHFSPETLYQQLVKFEDPLDFIAAEGSCWPQLHQGYLEDMAHGLGQKPMINETNTLVVKLPAAAWSYRVNGVLGNDLANQNPDKAIAVLTELDESHLAVSVRAPLNNRTGADELVRQFPTGGGRKAAAGINQLPKELLESFIEAMRSQWTVAAS